MNFLCFVAIRPFVAIARVCRWQDCPCVRLSSVSSPSVRAYHRFTYIYCPRHTNNIKGAIVRSSFLLSCFNLLRLAPHFPSSVPPRRVLANCWRRIHHILRPCASSPACPPHPSLYVPKKMFASRSGSPLFRMTGPLLLGFPSHPSFTPRICFSPGPQLAI